MSDLQIDVEGKVTGAAPGKTINDIKDSVKGLRAELNKSDIGSTQFNKLNSQLIATQAHLKAVTSHGRSATTSFKDLHHSLEGVHGILEKIGKGALALLGLHEGIRALKALRNETMAFARDYQTSAQKNIDAYEKSYNRLFTAIVNSDEFKKFIDLSSKALDFAAVLITNKKAVDVFSEYLAAKLNASIYKIKDGLSDLFSGKTEEGIETKKKAFEASINDSVRTAIKENQDLINDMSKSSVKMINGKFVTTVTTEQGGKIFDANQRLAAAEKAMADLMKEGSPTSAKKDDIKKATEEDVKAIEEWIKKQDEVMRKMDENYHKRQENKAKLAGDEGDAYMKQFIDNTKLQIAAIDEVDQAQQALFEKQRQLAEEATDVIYSTMTRGWKYTLAVMKADLIKSGILSAVTSIISGNPLSFVGAGLFGKGGLFGGLFAEGGYTPSGGKYQPAGIVHAGEWVASQNLLRNPETAAIIAHLEKVQRKGFADGGYTSNVSTPVFNNSMQAFLKFDGGAVRALDVELKTVAARDNARRGI